MARGRLVSKSLGSSRRFHALLATGGKLGEFCQLLYPLVVANTDDWGRMAGDAFTIKNVVLPTSRRTEEDFERALQVMHECGLIVRYVVDSDIYLQVNKFDEHQPGLTKRTASKFPEVHDDSGISVNLPLNLREVKRTESKGREPNVREPREREADVLFDRFWEAYPKKKAKDEARRAWDKRRPNESLLLLILASLAAQRQSEDWRKESGKYIPFPATWLNRGQWTDSESVDPAVVRNWMFECPHDPHCRDTGQCVALRKGRAS